MAKEITEVAPMFAECLNIQNIGAGAFKLTFGSGDDKAGTLHWHQSAVISADLAEWLSDNIAKRMAAAPTPEGVEQAARPN